MKQLFKLLIFAIVMLAGAGLFAQPYYIPFATKSPSPPPANWFGYCNVGIKVDSSVWFPKYKTTLTDTVLLGFTTTGLGIPIPKSSVQGWASTPNLQQVTTAGATTTIPVTLGMPAAIRQAHIFGSNTTNTIFNFAYNHQIANGLNLHEDNMSTTYQTVQRTTLDSNHYSDLQMFNYRIPPYTTGSIIIITNGFEDIRLDSANRTSYPAKFNTQLTAFINACKTSGYDTNHILLISPWFWLNPSFMPSPALTHQERFIAEEANVAAATDVRYVDIFHLMQPYGNQLLRSIDTTYPNQAGHDSISKWVLNYMSAYIDTTPKLNVYGRVNILNGGLFVDGTAQTGNLVIHPVGNLKYENEPNNKVTSTDGNIWSFNFDSVSPHATDFSFRYEYKNPQNTGFDSSWNPTVFFGSNVGVNGNQYDLGRSSYTVNFDQNIWTGNLTMGANNSGSAYSHRMRRARAVSTATSVPINFWCSNSVVNTALSSEGWLGTNNLYILNELNTRRSAFWDIYNTRLNMYDTLIMPNTMLGTGLTKVLIKDANDAIKHANVQSVINDTAAAIRAAFPSQLTISTGLTNTAGTVTNNLVTGIAGTGTATGSTDANGDLLIEPTTSATKTNAYIYMYNANVGSSGGAVGINVPTTSNPFSLMHLSYNGSNGFTNDNYGSTNSDHTNFYYARSARGTQASPTIVADGDIGLRLQQWNYHGAAFIQTAKMEFVVDGTPVSSQRVPSRIDWYTNLVNVSQTLNMRLASTGILSTKNIEPLTDDTYYLGENSATTPHAWKGVILKDTTNGNYYRIEVINGVITATAL